MIGAHKLDKRLLETLDAVDDIGENGTMLPDPWAILS
jgi:hypothetical protein